MLIILFTIMNKIQEIKKRRKLISNINKIIKNRDTASNLSFKYPKMRIKTQQTAPSVSPYSYRYSNKDTIESKQSNNCIQALPCMNDDFQDKEIVYKESFVAKKHRIMKLQFSKSIKFCYITLHDTKLDMHYKLRLLLETGNYILQKIIGHKLLFRDHIFRDQNCNYYIQVVFQSLDRKFQFKKYQPSIFKEQEQEYDDFLRNKISKLDRTESLMLNNFNI